MSVALVFNPHVFPHALRAFGSAPGEIPFARMLEAQNRIKRVEPIDTYEPSSRVPHSTISASMPTAALLPKLGELLPVDPEPKAQISIQQQRQVQIPATGRVLDLYI